MALRKIFAFAFLGFWQRIKLFIFYLYNSSYFLKFISIWFFLFPFNLVNILLTFRFSFRLLYLNFFFFSLAFEKLYKVKDLLRLVIHHPFSNSTFYFDKLRNKAESYSLSFTSSRATFSETPSYSRDPLLSSQRKPLRYLFKTTIFYLRPPDFLLRPHPMRVSDKKLGVFNEILGSPTRWH